ncbi:MAG: M48 family metallopeptidase [Halieaceae bacterium]|jgi:Zn-dependent protease with chaperone function|nr:M48 family metallopeptidase [Halieaceae bacterium]
MNFFEQQDIGRRNARLLLLLFITAVLLLILLANLLVAFFLWFGQDYDIYSGSGETLSGFWSYLSWAQFGGIGLAITSTVLLVVLAKWIHLSTGGKTVAEAMGGRRVLPQSDNTAERRCLNVVEEMALAANMPVPPLYVMDGERGINAFAAGVSPADVVVAVTRGTIDHLKRDELQGVIAHEFSHILNGDMRLNIRLAAMLKGITFIGDVGHVLLRSTRYARIGRSRGSDEGQGLLLLGLALWLLGWLGSVAAGFIKAAISREKEYLADAGAVQYTRNPEGIGDALKVIGGYVPGTLVHAARAAEMSHIFFGQIEHRLWQLFATHPPLNKRILRLDTNWDGQYIKRRVRHYQEQPVEEGALAQGVGRAAMVSAAILASTARPIELDSAEDADFGPPPDELEANTADRYQLPVAYVRYAHEPLGANALVYALLVSPDPEIEQRQLATIAGLEVAGLSDLVATLWPGVQALIPAQRLPLLEMCLPALKSVSLEQYQAFKNTLLQVIRADARTDLFEWCLFQLVRHYLDPEFIQVKASRPRYRSLKKVVYHLRIVLSMLAWEGSGEAQQVFRLAADELDFNSLQILPQDRCSVTAFSKGVHELANCYPLLKPRLLKAMALAAGSDGKISSVEREIITTIAAVMDCPVPSALDAQQV